MMMLALIASATIFVSDSVPDPITQGWFLCEQEGATRQLAPVGPTTRVLNLYVDGEKLGPVEPAGLQPMVATAEHVDYMVALGVSAIDILMSGKPAYTPGFGPAERGVYTLQVADAGRPECLQYDEAAARAKALGLDEFAKPDFAPSGSCLTLTRVEQDLSSYSHFVVSYVDSVASRSGYFRYVTQLRRASGDVVVEASIFAFEPPRKPTCAANQNALTLAHFLHEMD